MGFSRQEYWNGLPFPSPGDLPDSGIEPWSPTSWADALPSELPGKSAVQNADPDETQLGGLPVQQLIVANCAASACPGPQVPVHGPRVGSLSPLPVMRAASPALLLAFPSSWLSLPPQS